MINFDKLTERLGISIKNEMLIKQSFVHRSYINESKQKLNSNERLEFLGDSILSYIVSDYLYHKYPDLSEGELTNLRSSLVKTPTLALISKSINLGDYLLLSRGEEESGGRNNPSLLADTLEAVIGAIYVDQGLTAVKKIILEIILQPILPKIIKNKSYKDAKSMFQEKVQEANKISPLYKVVKEEGPDHAKKFTIGVYVGEKLWGKGAGKNKHEAEQYAAIDALEKCMNK